MIKDYFALVLRSLNQRKLRGSLTVLGILIGMAAVVSIISLGYGMQNAVNEEMEKVGKDRIIITPSGLFMGPTADVSTAELTEDDLDIIKKVRGIRMASGVLSETAEVEYRDEKEYLSIFGTPTDTESKKEIENIGFFTIKEGKQFKENDNYKAIAGYNIAYDTFDRDLGLGESIYIEGKKFDIIGIQEKAGIGVHDVIIRIPMDTARDLFDEPKKISMIFARVDEGFVPSEVAESVKKKLRNFRDVEEGEEDFSVQTAEKTISTFTTILQIINIVLTGIAAISLVVGGVGIMNTMYTSITERTKEIGIMKSIGARNSQILTLFLIESGFLGLAGGLLGVIIGVGLSKLVEFIIIQAGLTLFKSYFNFYWIIGVLIFSFAVGCLSGIAPARQASKLKPVEALRA